MKNYRNFILMLFVSFIFIIMNPKIADAASSTGSNIPFVLYLPLGILAAAVAAWIATIIQKIRHKI